LAARGHTVRFFAAEPPPRLDLRASGISFQRVAARAPPPVESSAQTLALAAALVEGAKDGMDVIHAHYAIPHAASAALALSILERAGAKRPRLVTTLHGTDVTELARDPAFRSVVRYAALESDAITVPSAWLRERVAQNLGIGPGSVDVIPNFVDTAVYAPRAGDLRHLFPHLQGWDSTRKPRILFHGSNFRPLKRVGDAVRALALLRRDREAGLVLVGDGPERESVKALAAELGQADHVCFLGGIPHFEPLLSSADLFLLPSEIESFGLAALEALSSGVPVVASAVAGIPEVVKDGVTGLLVRPGDPEAIAAAARLLFDDEPRRLAMARAARQDAAARFAPEPAIDRYERLLRGP
jgi:N-acetyl-alpha-D-glucosaminyl L-malate synthase BshA